MLIELQVKKTIERCLEQRMNKVEMFRVIREEGLPTWIAFAGEITHCHASCFNSLQFYYYDSALQCNV